MTAVGLGGARSALAVDSSAQRWRPWQQELTAGQDYTKNGGNPYRDLALTVQYWHLPAGTTTCGNPVTGGDSFSGYGFWDGGSWLNGQSAWSTPKRFLIRSTFPDNTLPGGTHQDGTWCWKSTCNLARPDASPSATLDCLGDTGLNMSGKVTVTTTTEASTNRLYALGLPKVDSASRRLVYWDGATPLLWLGDTAWDAPIQYGNGSAWATYVTDRVKKLFRTVLVAPATQSSLATGASPGIGFRSVTFPAPPPNSPNNNCTATELQVVPNRCTIWDTSYWSKLDELVRVANSTNDGMLVVVAGVMDPTVRGGTNNGKGLKFPSSPEAVVFARNLAARLAGHFAIFSPAYDAKGDDETAANKSVDGKTVLQLAGLVGTAIKSAAPRHLVGLHLSGSNALSTYVTVHPSPWLDFQMFQSGHGGSKAADNTCPFNNTDAGQFQRAVCRAREGALEFRCMHPAGTTALADCQCVHPAGSTNPTDCQPGGLDNYTVDRIADPKPAVNVEGEYEFGHKLVPDPANPNGPKILVRDWTQLNPSRGNARHTAWVTALSGSFGFNIGNWYDVTGWLNPQAAQDGVSVDGQTGPYKSDNDLQQMSLILGQAPWSQYEPNHKLVPANWPSGPGVTPKSEELKQHLAIAGRVVLVHVPGVRPNAQPVVTISRTGRLANVRCTNSSSTWKLPRGLKKSTDTGDTAAKCDDSVAGKLTFKVKPAGAQLNCSDGQQTCDWVLQILSDAVASTNAPNTQGGILTAIASKGSAVVNDLQVWTQTDDDSAGTSVWAQLLDADGASIGDPFLVHPVGARMRALPTATRDSLGNFLVAWEETGDDATDDIVAVQLSADGVILGSPFAVTPATGGIL